MTPGIGTCWLSSLEENNLGVPVGTKLNMSQPCVLVPKDDSTQYYVRYSIHSQEVEGDDSLLSTSKCYVQF